MFCRTSLNVFLSLLVTCIVAENNITSVTTSEIHLQPGTLTSLEEIQSSDKLSTSTIKEHSIDSTQFEDDSQPPFKALASKDEEKETAAIVNIFRNLLFLDSPREPPIYIERSKRFDLGSMFEKTKEFVGKTSHNVYDFSKNVTEHVGIKLKSLFSSEAQESTEKCGMEHVQILFMLHLPDADLKKKYLHIERKPYHDLSNILEDSFSQWMKEIEDENKQPQMRTKETDIETIQTTIDTNANVSKTFDTVTLEEFDTRLKRNQEQPNTINATANFEEFTQNVNDTIKKSRVSENFTEFYTTFADALNHTNVEETSTSKMTSRMWNIADKEKVENGSEINQVHLEHFLFNSGGAINRTTAKPLNILNLAAEIDSANVNRTKRVKRMIEQSILAELGKLKDKFEATVQANVSRANHEVLKSSTDGIHRNVQSLKIERSAKINKDNNLIEDYNAGAGKKTKPYFLIVTLPTVLCFGLLFGIMCFLLRPKSWCCNLFIPARSIGLDESTEIK